MDEYEALRQQAARKRNMAIRLAREEYTASLKRIKELKRRLRAPASVDGRGIVRPIRELIVELMPRDRMFSVDDIHTRLSASDRNRRFLLSSARHIMSLLAKEGVIKRVHRAGPSGGPKVLWAAAEFTPERISVFGARSMLSIAEEVLRQRGPMRCTEIVMYLQERNYRAEADPRILSRTLASILARKSEKFRRRPDRRWEVVSA